MNPQYLAIEEIKKERQRQIDKWGDQSDNSLFHWMSILMEEVGELAQAINDMHYSSLEAGTKKSDMEKCLTEAIQTAAVATAIIEALYGKNH